VRLRLGTRGSALALAQAGWVAEALGGAELVTLTTSGDRGVGPGDKSRWVAELEAALLAGEIDFAVHSAKDVPAELEEGLVVSAVPAREDPRDVLCGAASLDALTPGARVGTSSLRRIAQVRAAREDLDVVPMRGNVDTRLRKLSEGECDAVVLARAGLARLGRLEAAGGALDAVPAAGQGALLIEGRAGDDRVAALTDAAALAAVSAERALVRELGATCHTPIGAHAALDGGELVLRAWLGLPDGSAWLRDERRGPAAEPEALGREVGERMRAAGADELLREAEAFAG
jgi:hydroxymethylbilane synthase